ncbi:hypothetical protein GYA13_05060 [Candidatus Kuenenbacteria bacterium]|nr:hypothetical protein [Candidatus Kuenenbacteria bacterium]
MDEQTKNEALRAVYAQDQRDMTWPESRNAPGRTTKKNFKWRQFGWLAALVAVVAIVTAVVVFWPSKEGVYSRDKWQAVFLNNNQVFFGHVTGEDNGHLILKDIYYPQKPLTLQQPTEEQPNDFTLVKFGKEIYGTEDQMVINKDNILYVADIKEESKIVAAIKKYQEKK